MIPQTITRDHVVRALLEIDAGAIPPERQSVDYDLVHEGKRYPPKYAISIAHKLASGAELEPDQFNPQQAFGFLKRLGFSIVKRSRPTQLGPEADVESVRLVFERLVPEAARKTIAEMFADAIERAHQAGEARWEITLQPELIRLNAGRVLICDICRGSSAIGIVLDALDAQTRARVEEVTTRVEDFAVLPDDHLYHLPFAELIALWPTIRDAFLQFVDKGALTARRCVWARSHAPAVVDFLSDFLGRDLPRPVYGNDGFDRRIYWVNQGRTFEMESDAGYLFAAQKDARGATPGHWQRLRQLVPGDIVVHYAEGSVRAVSRVRSPAVDATRSEESKEPGWRVDVELWRLPNPVALRDLLAANSAVFIGADHGPLDKNGDIKQGYLYELDEDGLAAIRATSGDVDAWPAWTKSVAARFWMFHANPEMFDLRAAVKDLRELTWQVRQHKREIGVDDTVFLWEGGANSAIVGVARVLSEPAVMPPNAAEEPYEREKHVADDGEPIVRLAIERVLDPVLSGDDLRAEPSLATLLAFTSPQRTNSSVSRAQAELLLEWLDGGRPTRIVKITPGERGELWNECLKAGYICVGWDDVGDLQNYARWSAFRKAFGESCERDKPQSHVTAKAHELWVLARLRPGDRIVANRGTSHVLGVGTVKAPGYIWNATRPRFKHTVLVDWDTSIAADVPAYKHWGVTTVDKVPINIIEQILPDLAPTRDTTTHAKRPASVAPAVESPFATLQRALKSREARLWFSDDLIAHYLLALQSKRFVILTGVSGTGKTQLALAVAKHFRPTTRTLQFAPPPAGAVSKRVVPSMIQYRRMVVPSAIAMGLRLRGLSGSGTSPIDVEYPGGQLQLDCYRHVRATSEVHQIPLKAGLAEWLTSIPVGEEFLIERIETGDHERDRIRFSRPVATEVNSTVKNFAVIAVRPDWTDGRGLLGFYNHLTRRYVTTPFLRLMLAADEEYRRATAERRAPAPFFAILDEMNLARVEQYFSDFLSALESNEPLSLHGDPNVEEGVTDDEDEDVMPVPRELVVPPNLFFTGTVNVDETTYMFSPKVLDRAFVIEFNDVDLDGYGLRDEEDGSGALALVSWQGFEAHRPITAADWDALEKIGGGDARKALKQVHAILERDNRHFGYRVANEIARFLTLASKQCAAPAEGLMDALDLAIISKVLPKLHGTQQEIEEVLCQLFAFAIGADNPAKPEEWTAQDRQLVVHTQGEGTQEPWLPRSSLKLWRMIRRVRAQGFTSFIE